MTKTTNYQLNQWAKSDRVMMDDFNADNAKIDAALKANADAIAAAAAAQTNCTVVCGTYTGTGGYTADNKNTLTFAGKPMLVIVYAVGGSNKMLGLVFGAGCQPDLQQPRHVSGHHLHLLGREFRILVRKIRR